MRAASCVTMAVIAGAMAIGACAEGSELDGSGGATSSSQAAGPSPTGSSGGPTTSTNASSSGTLAGVVGTNTGASSQATSVGSGSTTSGMLGDRLCAAGELLVGVDAQGAISCAPFAPTAVDVVRESCSLYFGQRDSCDGCALAPTKWGSARTGACTTSGNVNDTCTTATLGGVMVSLYGMNTLGDMDENDKLYFGLSCTPGTNGETLGACPDGSFATAVAGAAVTCTEASGAIVERVGAGCHGYWGWLDSCGSCMNAPSRWGRSSSTTCENGAGATNTCTTPSLGGVAVQTFGLNTGGDVDDNDKLYVGLACDTALDSETTVMGACPAGSFVSGIFAGGSLRCTRPDETATAAFRDHCSIYYGWRDSCTACSLAPTKWGFTSAIDCTSDGAVGNTCQNLALGGVSLPTLGLNPDGNVDENDKLYVGFHCQ